MYLFAIFSYNFIFSFLLEYNFSKLHLKTILSHQLKSKLLLSNITQEYEFGRFEKVLKDNFLFSITSKISVLDKSEAIIVGVVII